MKGMTLFPFGENNRYGEIELNKPEGYVEGTKEPAPPERLPQLLASLCYGCFFQSYYMRKYVAGQPGKAVMGDFNHCFNVGGDGQCDAREWRSNISNSQTPDAYGRLSEIERDYFEGLVTNNAALDAFMQLQPLDYLQRDKMGNYIGNIGKLNNDCQPLIEEHYLDYLKLIDQYKAVLQLA
jgi:hypothetical protein